MIQQTQAKARETKKKQQIEENVKTQGTNLYCVAQDATEGFSDWAEISTQAEATF